MTAEMECEQVKELAPELALCIAAGEERDAALRHLTGCAGCRRLVAELSSVGDELLLLAPARSRPSGSSPASWGRSPRRRRLQPLAPRWRWVAVAAAVVLAAALGAGSVFLATAGDRRFADGYQAVLRQGQGSFLAAAPLQAAQRRVGTVYGYQGIRRGSW
jgi:anti-sigma factor RsiW